MINARSHLILIAVLLLGVCAQAHADRRQKQGNLNPMRLGKMIKKLGVDKAAERKIRAILFETRKSMIGLKAKRDEHRLELEKLMSVSEPQRAKVMTLIEQIGQISTDIRKKRVGTMLTIRDMLTEEQRQELTSLMERQRVRRGDRRRHRQGQRNDK